MTVDERAELRDLLYSAHVPAAVAMRARIVLWRAENRLKKDIAVMAGCRGRRWICGCLATAPRGSRGCSTGPVGRGESRFRRRSVPGSWR